MRGPPGAARGAFPGSPPASAGIRAAAPACEPEGLRRPRRARPRAPHWHAPLRESSSSAESRRAARTSVSRLTARGSGESVFIYLSTPLRAESLTSQSWAHQPDAMSAETIFIISRRRASTSPDGTLTTPPTRASPHALEAITGTPRATPSNSLRGLCST